MIKRSLVSLLLLALVAVFVLPGLSQAAPEAWPSKVKLGVIPTEGAADSAKRFMPLTDHLENVLGIDIEVFTASDYAGIITAMANGHIDLAYFGPKSYTEAAEKANAQAMVMELDASGQPGYNGIIIVRKDSGINSMAEAKGKTFTFTDPNSTSGFLVPNVLFARDLEVKPETYFKEVRFSGSHGASILAVKNGSIDVAATNNVDMDRMAEKGSASWDDFKVLWTSDLIPGAPMCARRDLPESLKAAYAGALLMLNTEKGTLEKLGNGGYAYCDDATYDIIRYLQKLKAELQAKQ